MDKNNQNLQEQDAPLKNTDQAFVQVNDDGTSSFPVDEETGEEKDTKES
jgi:hypothetical protein